ncbi:aspartyl protease family protein [Eisenibacter elegans]|jgi:hypothetical protein|uniref:aspartyl protease family protein n=1 Tax=Eisenibacter elegans TaxID=997 RepID=UPI0004108044|nr:aspartyl protease family protein [Eisenibacter elegans]
MLWAQENHHAQDYMGFGFKRKGVRYANIEFKQHNNLIVLPVLVEGLQDTLNFVLDTGAGYSIITDTLLGKQLNLPHYRDIAIEDDSGDTILRAYVSNIPQMTIGEEIITRRHSLLVLSEDVLYLSEYAGVKIHGILGYDIFSRFIVKVDYPRRQVVFYNPHYYKQRKDRKTVQIPVEVVGLKPYVSLPVQVKYDDNQAHPLRLLFDIGAGHAISLEKNTHPTIVAPEEAISSYIGTGMGGLIYGQLGRIPAIKVGHYQLEQVIATFPDSLSKRYKSIDRNGSIGYNLLKRFDLTINYVNEWVRLRPNKRFKEPFSYNTSGMYLTAEAPDYNRYKVSYTQVNSPAWLAGLQEGDEIITLDNFKASDLRMSGIYNLLHKKEGKVVSIFIRREGAFYYTEMALNHPLQIK